MGGRASSDDIGVTDTGDESLRDNSGRPTPDGWQVVRTGCCQTPEEVVTVHGVTGLSGTVSGRGVGVPVVDHYHTG